VNFEVVDSNPQHFPSPLYYTCKYSIIKCIKIIILFVSGGRRTIQITLGGQGKE